MRLSILVGSLVLMSVFGGCVDPAQYPQWDSQTNTTFGSDGNATVPAPNSTTAASPVEPSAPRAAPPVPTVAYTAPVPIELARVEGDGATLSLVAGPEGLSCVAEPSHDPDAAPRGYRLIDTWSSCTLSADNTTFARQDAEAWDVDLAVLHEIPVDNFTWEMEVGRVIENNTGAREQTVVEASQRVWAAPSLGLDTEPSWPQACATWLGGFDGGVETILLRAQADTGRAILETDLSSFHVLEWSSPQNATEDNGTTTVLGDWALASVAELEVTIEFQPQDPHYLAIGVFECPTATSFEFQEVPFQALAEGIAAGWHEGREGQVRVEVFSNEF